MLEKIATKLLKLIFCETILRARFEVLVVDAMKIAVF
jgi:hypothetical protein